MNSKINVIIKIPTDKHVRIEEKARVREHDTHWKMEMIIQTPYRSNMNIELQ